MRSDSQLNIKNPETRRLAKELADLTGRSVTDVVTDALRERLERERKARSKAGVAERLRELAEEFSQLPVLDDRDPDEMLYDEYGLPK
jgi:antitoxin VapB